MDSAAQVLVDSVEPGEMKIQINQTSHLELQLALVTDSQSLQSSLADQAANISLQLSEEENSGAVVVLKSYKTLGCIINAQQSCSSPRISSKQVNSLVVGADVYQHRQEERRERKEKVEKISVEITFSHVFPGSQYNLSQVGDTYNFPCMEVNYPYATKNQRGAISQVGGILRSEATSSGLWM